ncbi:hypothetical protein GCM10022278_39090 [Allohahella marinimesophila]|uniref:Uncharacterized protein n=1 Tax=Allohahella marinimesophila TaxID=1054972 RepID=A0ABP7QC18_9GAMM
MAVGIHQQALPAFAAGLQGAIRLDKRLSAERIHRQMPGQGELAATPHAFHEER